MKIFADWGDTKKWQKVEVDGGSDIVSYYMETGCPRQQKFELLSKGYEIYEVKGENINKYRTEMGLMKTDEGDAELIRQYYDLYPEDFAQFKGEEKSSFILKYHATRYHRATKTLASIKNVVTSYEKEFGSSEAFKDIIRIMEREKASQLKTIKPYIREELKIGDKIKGANIARIGQIVGLAHPNRFKSKAAYRKYCGFMEDAKASGRYNRTVKSLFYEIAKGTLMANDPVFRPKYDEYKEEFMKYSCDDCWLTKNRHKCSKRKKTMETGEPCKVMAHTKAMNRLATDICNFFYEELNGIEGASVYGTTFDTQQKLV